MPDTTPGATPDGGALGALLDALSRPFSAAEWPRALHALLPTARLLARPVALPAAEGGGARGLYLGAADMECGRRLALYSFGVEPGRPGRARASLAALARRMLRAAQDADAALAVFDDGGGGEWRLSLVSDLRGVGVETEPRRFTFLLGPGDGRRTPRERLEGFARGPRTFARLREAFSVEALARQFYGELFEWYLWATSDGAGVTFPNDVTTPDDDRDDLEVKMMRLLTRVLFTWFIMHRGLVPRRLFDTAFLKGVLRGFDPLSATEGRFYNAILQNLFFAALNRPRGGEGGGRRFAKAPARDIKTLFRYAEMFAVTEAEAAALFDGVPFVGGGLFECLDKAPGGAGRARNLDGFSRDDARFADGRPRHRAVVPDRLFFDPRRGLVPLLSRYNFTVRENTPLDQAVALDPELLGRVFENLLGAYNPETRDTARRDSGSFYTPRDVVALMVDEALRARLGGGPLADALLAPGFDAAAWPAEDLARAAATLRQTRAMDPACGSGAFPMGLLQRMTELLLLLEPGADPARLRLQVAERCIFGADIQPIAVQITRLRFLLSIVCDADGPAPGGDGAALPNLETNIVCADALRRLRPRPRQGSLFEDPEVGRLRDGLARARHANFAARTAAEKAALRRREGALRRRLAAMLEAGGEWAADDARQMAAWDPYDQGASAPFLDTGWMTGVPEGGFDIVIGNPPYVQLQKNGGALAERYAAEGYEAMDRRADLYCLFFERGLAMLREGGALCYITSNKWLRAAYGRRLRGLLARRADPALLLDFAGGRVFEGATVDTAVALLLRRPNGGRALCAAAAPRGAGGPLLDRGAAAECAFTTDDPWVPLSPMEGRIRRKVEAAGRPLGEWGVSINYGIKTGCNEAFVVTSERREQILAACRDEGERRRTEALIRPVLRGRDVKRWRAEWAGLWMICTFPSRHYDIDDYPAVRDYLLSFGRERLEQTGKTYVVNGEKIHARKKTNNKWFETQDSISYWGDFARRKIVWGEISDKPKFALDSEGKYAPEATTFLMTCDAPEYLLCFLNSKIAEWLFSKVGTTTGVGTVRWKKFTVEQLVVPLLPKEVTETFKEFVDGFLRGKIDAETLQRKADALLYEVLGLDGDERAFVEAYSSSV